MVKPDQLKATLSFLVFRKIITAEDALSVLVFSHASPSAIRLTGKLRTEIYDVIQKIITVQKSEEFDVTTLVPVLEKALDFAETKEAAAEALTLHYVATKDMAVFKALTNRALTDSQLGDSAILTGILSASINNFPIFQSHSLRSSRKKDPIAAVLHDRDLQNAGAIEADISDCNLPLSNYHRTLTHIPTPAEECLARLRDNKVISQKEYETLIHASRTGKVESLDSEAVINALNKIVRLQRSQLPDVKPPPEQGLSAFQKLGSKLMFWQGTRDPRPTPTSLTVPREDVLDLNNISFIMKTLLDHPYSELQLLAAEAVIRNYSLVGNLEAYESKAALTLALQTVDKLQRERGMDASHLLESMERLLDSGDRDIQIMAARAITTHHLCTGNIVELMRLAQTAFAEKNHLEQYERVDPTAMMLGINMAFSLAIDLVRKHARVPALVEASFKGKIESNVSNIIHSSFLVQGLVKAFAKAREKAKWYIPYSIEKNIDRPVAEMLRKKRESLSQIRKKRLPRQPVIKRKFL